MPLISPPGFIAESGVVIGHDRAQYIIRQFAASPTSIIRHIVLRDGAFDRQEEAADIDAAILSYGSEENTMPRLPPATIVMMRDVGEQYAIWCANRYEEARAPYWMTRIALLKSVIRSDDITRRYDTREYDASGYRRWSRHTRYSYWRWCCRWRYHWYWATRAFDTSRAIHFEVASTMLVLLLSWVISRERMRLSAARLFTMLWADITRMMP